MREYTNNAAAQLAAGINDSVTALAVQTGQGALFPSIAAAPTHFMATLVDSANNIEIVKVTARSGDNFTIVRGQEGTTAKTYSAGDRVELRQTAAGHNINLQIGQVRNMAVAGGTVDALTAAFPNSSDAALENGMRFCVQAGGANATTTPTLNVTLGSTATGAKTIVKGSNLPLAAGDIPGADYPCDFQYDLSLDKYVLMNPAIPASSFVAGTRMLFQQTTPPVGWTKETNATYNDAALRLITGTIATGGSATFSASFGGSGVVGGTSISSAQMPSHQHAMRVPNGTASPAQYMGPTSALNNNVGLTNTNNTTSLTGSGSSHDHTLPTLKYVDLVVASKD